jgi:hypothetical protein
VVACEKDGRDDLLRRSAGPRRGGGAVLAPYCSALDRLVVASEKHWTTEAVRPWQRDERRETWRTSRFVTM